MEKEKITMLQMKLTLKDINYESVVKMVIQPC